MSQSGSSKVAEKSPSKKMQKETAKLNKMDEATAASSAEAPEKNTVPGIVFREVKKEKMEKEKKAATETSTATKKRMKMLATKKAKVKVQSKRKEKSVDEAESAAKKDETVPEVDESQVIENVVPLNSARPEQCVDLEADSEEKKKKEEEVREKKKEFERRRKEEEERRRKEEEERRRKEEEELRRKEEEEQRRKKAEEMERKRKEAEQRKLKEEEERKEREELEKKKREEEEWKEMMKEIREEAEKKIEDEAPEPASMEAEEAAAAKKAAGEEEKEDAADGTAAEEKKSAEAAEEKLAKEGPEQTEELETDEDFTGYYSSEEGKKEEKQKSAEEADVIEKSDGWSTEEDREKKKPRKGKVAKLEKKRKRAAEGKLPKKKKAKAESSAKLAKAEAAEKKRLAWEALKGKQFLQEQGFDPELKDIPENILRKIADRGWQKLCVPQAHEARGAWVREFYAGIEDEESFSSQVQGKAIDWSPEKWNELFGIERGGECEYEQLLRAPSKTLLAKCLRTIGNEEAEWSGGVQKKTFQSCMLNEEAHVWATFAKSCLLPTSHDSSLTTERCLLIFAIMEGLYIDVGKLIAQEIKRWMLKSIGKIFFPHSISALCASHGVKKKPSDDIQKPRKPLNANAKPKIRIPKKKKRAMGVGVAAGIAEMLAEQDKMREDLRKFYAYVYERDMALKDFYAEFKQPGPLIPEFPDILREDSSEEE